MSRSLLKLAGLFGALAVAVACAGAFLAGCAPAGSPSVDTRALARGTVSVLASAWVDSANGCLAVAEAQATPADQSAFAKKCEGILDPIRASLIAAGDAVDTWTVADQSNFPCLLQQFVTDLKDSETALTALNVTLPTQEINDGLSLAEAFLPQCQANGDGGSPQ